MKTAKQKLLALGLSVCLAMGMSVPTVAADTQQPVTQGDMTGKIVILHTNDSHGRMAENLGFAGVKALKTAYENAGAQVLVLDAGDTLHGKPIVNLSQGSTAVDMMNAVGYDAMVPGNHDFNYTAKRLSTLASRMTFPLLAANVSWQETGRPFAKNNVIIEKDGKKIGIFGLASPETIYKSSPKNVAGLVFTNPTKAAREQVKSLKEQGAHYIVALSHVGMDKASNPTSTQIAQMVPGIDIIIDGHSHTLLENGQKVGKTLLASTGNYLEHIGVVVIDESGKATASVVNVGEYTEQDAKIKNSMDALKAKVDSQLSDVIGRTPVALDGAREHVRAGETNLGNLITDAMRSASGAQIALFNGGGIRATIPAGSITKAQILETLPFGNYLVVKSLKGSEIVEALEKGVSDYPALSGGFPHVSGLTFELNAAAPKGKRVSNVLVGGQALKLSASYTIAVNDFMAVGGDGYTMFEGKRVVAEYPNLEELVMQFLTANPGYVAKSEGRITMTGEAAAQKMVA